MNKKSCFLGYFSPLIEYRVFEMGKRIHLLRVGGTYNFCCTNFVILDPSSVYHPTASAHIFNLSLSLSLSGLPWLLSLGSLSLSIARASPLLARRSL